MGRKIHKYTLDVMDEQVIALPHDGKVLHFADQKGKLCIWVEFDEDMVFSNDNPQGCGDSYVTFFVVGTGNPIPDRATHYIGSTLSGPFVWHLYSNWNLK